MGRRAGTGIGGRWSERGGEKEGRIITIERGESEDELSLTLMAASQNRKLPRLRI